MKIIYYYLINILYSFNFKKSINKRDCLIVKGIGRGKSYKNVKISM